VHKISDLVHVLLLALLSCSSQACKQRGHFEVAISRLLIEGTKSWNIRDWREVLRFVLLRMLCYGVGALNGLGDAFTTMQSRRR